MDRTENLKRLKELFESEFLNDQPVELDATTPLLRLGVLDSFSLLRLTVVLEEKFGIKVPLETVNLEQFKDLNSIAELIESRRSSD